MPANGRRDLIRPLSGNISIQTVQQNVYSENAFEFDIKLQGHGKVSCFLLVSAYAGCRSRLGKEKLVISALQSERRFEPSRQRMFWLETQYLSGDINYRI